MHLVLDYPIYLLTGFTPRCASIISKHCMEKKIVKVDFIGARRTYIHDIFENTFFCFPAAFRSEDIKNHRWNQVFM